MAGQFDKFVKILGNAYRPDRYKGAPGNPDIVSPIEVPEKSANDIGGKNTNINRADVNLALGAREDLVVRDTNIQRRGLRENARKRQAEGLKSTTMRVNEQTGEAYDTDEVRPSKARPVSNLLSKGYVKPTGRDPEFTPTPITDDQASEISRPGGKLLDQKNATRSAQEATRQDLLSGENAFNAKEGKSGSTLRSLNGITYDVSERRAEVMAAPANSFGTYTSDLKSAAKANDVIPASTVSAKPTETSSPKVFPKLDSWEEPKTSNISSSGIKTDAVTKSGESGKTASDIEQNPTFLKVNKIKARKGGTIYADKSVDNYQREHPDSPASSAATGKTLSSANMGTTPYDKAGNVKPEYNDPSTIYSTTMHEHNGEVVEGGVRKAPYTKPPVAKTGNVIPPMAIDTFGAQPTDREQAAKENRRLREGRGTPTRTTVFDPNVRSARPARGKTPERQAVLGSIREERAASLADEGKEMTTVSPEVMDTAKGLGATTRYNLDENYMNSTSFLSHEAVQKATVAHALGVHHSLAEPDEGHLGRYLGGRPLEAKERLAYAFKIVDRNRRGNPEKVPGEFSLLRGMVHAGSSPQKTLRAARSGASNDVVVNGQNVTLASGSSENRQKIADTTTNITAQAESAPKAARLGSVAATPTAPLAGTGRVAVRRIGQNPEEAQIREFSPQESRNLRTKVPRSDDSKSKSRPVESEVNEESTTVLDRLKKGPKLDESEK